MEWGGRLGHHFLQSWGPGEVREGLQSHDWTVRMLGVPPPGPRALSQSPTVCSLRGRGVLRGPQKATAGEVPGDLREGARGGRGAALGSGARV